MSREYGRRLLKREEENYEPPSGNKRQTVRTLMASGIEGIETGKGEEMKNPGTQW